MEWRYQALISDSRHTSRHLCYSLVKWPGPFQVLHWINRVHTTLKTLFLVFIFLILKNFPWLKLAMALTIPPSNGYRETLSLDGVSCSPWGASLCVLVIQQPGAQGIPRQVARRSQGSGKVYDVLYWCARLFPRVASVLNALPVRGDWTSW